MYDYLNGFGIKQEFTKEKASTYFSKAIAQNPNDSRARIYYAIFLQREGDLFGAEEHIVRAIISHPRGK